MSLYWQHHTPPHPQSVRRVYRSMRLLRRSNLGDRRRPRLSYPSLKMPMSTTHIVGQSSSPSTCMYLGPAGLAGHPV